MYLALCLSPESEQAIRTAVPAAGELHLTVIHSPEPIAKLKKWREVHTSEAWDALKAASAMLVEESLEAHSEGIVTFGGKTKVAALKLNLTNKLDVFRTLAEAVLFDASIPWSKQWSFSPHITLGRGKVKLAETFPSVVTFDRMEWRE
jgi:2'-5' RNA ligase